MTLLNITQEQRKGEVHPRVMKTNKTQIRKLEIVEQVGTNTYGNLLDHFDYLVRKRVTSGAHLSPL